jgi:hypothetical protein
MNTETVEPVEPSVGEQLLELKKHNCAELFREINLMIIESLFQVMLD